MLKRGRWGVRKERVEGRKAYNGGQEATRERNSSHFLLLPTSSLLSGLICMYKPIARRSGGLLGICA